MKHRTMAAVVLAAVMGASSYSVTAGDLTGIRVSNHEGTSRVVLELSEMPVSWTGSYSEDARVVSLHLGGTSNRMNGPVSNAASKTGVLKGVSVQDVKGSLQVKLQANRDVSYHSFTLSSPNRLVVDLFSSYSQQTTKDISDSVRTSKINSTVAEGIIQAFAVTVDKDTPMTVGKSEQGKTLKAVNQAHTVAVGAKVKGRSYDRPYAVSPDGVADVGRITTTGTLRYTPNRGYFIESKAPLLQGKTPKTTFTITSVDVPRKENALTLYTSAYGNSTKTNDFGYEITVSQGKVVSVAKGNSPLKEGQFVLSGHGEARETLRKIKVGTPVTVQNRPELARVNTAGGASLEGGTLLLRNGHYLKQADETNGARSFVGTTKDNKMVIVAVDKKEPESVGITPKEGAQLLAKLGAVDGMELSYQGSVDMTVNGAYVHRGSETPQQYDIILLIK